MTFKNFVSPHVHQRSLDTGARIKDFVKRELELGTGYLTCTDHGSMAACWEVYKAAQKAKLKPILGVEGYFRDDNCPLLLAAGAQRDSSGTLKDFMKYAHLTVHALDQPAYEAMIRILSRADLVRGEQHGSERKPLFNWADLEELGGFNITMTTGCLVGMVQRHLKDGHGLDLARGYYQKYKSLCRPGNFYVELLPHVCDSYWQSACFLTWADGKTESEPVHRQLRFRDSDLEKAKVGDLAKKKQPLNLTVTGVMRDRKWVDIEPRVLTGVAIREGFFKNDPLPWCPDGDLQTGCNRAMLYLAKEYGDRILIADDAHFAYPEQQIAQNVRLMASSGSSWRFANSYHRRSGDEAWAYFQEKLGISDLEFEEWTANGYEWASRFDNFKLKAQPTLPVKFYPDDTFFHTMALVEKVGRMDWNNPRWVERLQAEIKLLHENGSVDLLPYFFVSQEVCEKAEAWGELAGPGRGSAAGLLLTYLLGITHVEPLRYNLSMERFLTLSRIRSGKMPDIDQDLPGPARERFMDPERGWLRERFGDHTAQISTETTLKLKSSIKDVARMTHDGRVPPEIEELTKKMLVPPQGIEDRDFIFGYDDGDGNHVEGSIDTDPALQQYIRQEPGDWETVQACLGLARNRGRHASAVVIANKPVADFIPMTVVGGVPVTAYTMGSVEAAGAMKYDFLGLNSLSDIKDAITLVQERHGGLVQGSQTLDGKRVPGPRLLPVGDRFYDIWDLPEDQAVFHDFCESKTETVFQFNTTGAVKFLKEFNNVKFTDPNGTVHKGLDSIGALATFTALDRKGPLDYYVEDPVTGARRNMLQEYAARVRGEPAIGAVPVLQQMLLETHGVIVYQEQLQRVFQVLGKTTAEEADEFRVHISKKMVTLVEKDREVFLRGAAPELGEDVAKSLFDSMQTFAGYGFNASHAVCYVHISYACAYLKHHYPLEWWTAVLRNADKNEINDTFWRFCGHLIALPDVNRSGNTFVIEGDRIRAPANLLQGIGEKAHAQLLQGAPYRDIDDYCQKVEAFKVRGTVPVLDGLGEPVLVTVKDKKTKAETQVPKTRAGHSALSNSITSSLILSGAMESLFPAGTLPLDQLQLYVEASNRASGKKGCKVEKVNPKYLKLNAALQYQIRKSVLPAYPQDLTEAVVTCPALAFNQDGNGRLRVKFGGDSIPFVRAQELDQIQATTPWPDEPVVVALAAYVVSERRFNYGDGRKKEACEYIFDVGGCRYQQVRWPDRLKNKLEGVFAQKLTGAVVIVLSTKYREDKPFSVSEIIVVQPPLGADDGTEGTGGSN